MVEREPLSGAERGSGPSWGRGATQARPYAFPARPHLHGATRPSCCLPQSGPPCRFPAASAPGRPPLAGGSWLGAAGHARFSRENVSLPFPRPAPSLLGDKSERAARTRLPRLSQSQRGVRAVRSPLPSGEPGKGRVLAAQRSQPVFPARSPASHSGGIKAPEEPPSLNARWLKNGNSIRNRASSSRKKRNKLPDFEAASAGRQCGARGRAGCAVEAGGRGAAR